jgi:hypothetical protein
MPMPAQTVLYAHADYAHTRTFGFGDDVLLFDNRLIDPLFK